jgi:8-oxo-dGTP pyrophosphatase MutT (NUDIX family)
MRRFLENLLLLVAAYVRALLLHPVDLGVLALVEQAGRVVMVRHSYKSGWMLPGGGVKRGETPAGAIIRELQEEIGLTHSVPPQLFGVFVRRRFLVSNVILLYRVREAVSVFKPGFEVRELRLADPASPPPGTSPATRRRFSELVGEATPLPHW